MVILNFKCYGILCLVATLLIPSDILVLANFKDAMNAITKESTENPKSLNKTTDHPSYTLLPSYEIPFGQGDAGNLPFLYKKEPCTKTDEEIFESEIILGKCRADFITDFNEKIHFVIYMTIPPNSLINRDQIYEMITQNLDKVLDDNIIAKNAADAVTMTFELACSLVGGPTGAIIGSIGKPVVRKIAILVMKQTCRMAGCCVPNENDISCCREA